MDYKVVTYKDDCPVNDCDEGYIFQTDFGMGGHCLCSYCDGYGYVIREKKVLINNHIDIYGLSVNVND